MRTAARTRSLRPAVRRTVIAGLACSLLVIGLAPAVADDLPTSPPDEPEGGISDPSAHVLTYQPEGHVLHYAAEGHVQHLGEGPADEPNVIVLQSDILFDINSWELPGSAAERIAELVEDVPEGASVQVQGHTDSNPVGAGHDFDNQKLSQERAQAVADALAEVRGDLRLEVAGLGSSQPAVTEDPDDSSTYAANRRVEIRYEQ